MTFHKQSLNLAGLYLIIIMVISIFFSGSIYQLSLRELDHGLRRPSPALEREPIAFGILSITRDAINQEREQQYSEARSRLLARLIITNIIILIAGGVLSYYLARRTLQPIEEAHAALERFTADASHELRTPIAAMQSEIEVALMNPKLSLSKAKYILHSNHEELLKLTSLSEGLLRLAQIEDGNLPKSEIVFENLIEEAVQRILPSAEKKNILLINESKSNSKIMGDQTSLVEALCVILDNAVKYSPEKTEVRIWTAAKHKQLDIHIKDQGIGIKATELLHVFERFYRADTARSKTKTDGYGIGLALAKNIIEYHKGTMSVKSQPGRGATFSIHLPTI